MSEEVKAYLRTLEDHFVLQTLSGDILAVHGSPRRINEYLFEDRPASAMQRMAREYPYPAILFGHTHLPYARQVGETTFVNVGSAGRPKDGDWRVCYAIVDPARIGRGEAFVEFVRVAYDYARLLADMAPTAARRRASPRHRRPGRSEPSMNQETVGAAAPVTVGTEDDLTPASAAPMWATAPPPAVARAGGRCGSGACRTAESRAAQVLARLWLLACRSGCASGGGVLLWAIVYHYWLPVATWLTEDVLHLTTGRLALSLQFFIYDTVKVLLLLTIVVFGVGIVRSFFTRAHAGPVARQTRVRGQRAGRPPGHRDAVLHLLGRAAFHRLRRDRRAAGRHLLLPHLRAHGQRDRPGAAVWPVRLEGGGPLPGARAC